MINFNLTRMRRSKHRYIFYYESPTTQLRDESPTTQMRDESPTTQLRDESPTTQLRDESPTTQLRGFFMTDSAREGIAFCVKHCWNYFHKRIF